jgi:mannose-6-phosphate isomerase-like protein (cupin superfamily)
MATQTLPEQSQAYILGPEDGEVIENLGLRILAGDAHTGGALLAGEVTNPGPGGPPLHTHATTDELYLVLQGRYRFKLPVQEQEQEGGPGTFVYAPRGTSHTFASVGPEEGRLFCITLPGAEQFLRGISELQTQGVDQREMVAHFHTFDTGIDGPPLV